MTEAEKKLEELVELEKARARAAAQWQAFIVLLIVFVLAYFFCF